MKISKTGVTRYQLRQILRIKNALNSISIGALPQTPLGSVQLFFIGVFN